jgi:hypothetical protein
LATVAPAAAATRAAAVEMLKVPLESAPVPQVSVNVLRSASLSGMGDAHGVDEAGDFGGCGAAGGERAEEGGEFEFGGLAAEDGLEELGGVGAGEGLVTFDDSFEVGLEGHWFKGSR